MSRIEKVRRKKKKYASNDISINDKLIWNRQFIYVITRYMNIFLVQYDQMIVFPTCSKLYNDLDKFDGILN